METNEPNQFDQDNSPSDNKDEQPEESMSEELAAREESSFSQAKQPDQEPNAPPAQVCPFCQQVHAASTVYCPVTGKPLGNIPQVSAPPPQAQAYPPVQGYAPQQPHYPGAAQPPYFPPPYNPNYPQRAPKDRNIALVLEILPGLFGILGIGWIYSGKTGTGIAWLIGYLIWVGIAILAAVFSGTLACFCTVPINLVCVGISAYSLNNYVKNNPQLFGAL